MTDLHASPRSSAAPGSDQAATAHLGSEGPWDQPLPHLLHVPDVPRLEVSDRHRDQPRQEDQPHDRLEEDEPAETDHRRLTGVLAHHLLVVPVDVPHGEKLLPHADALLRGDERRSEVLRTVPVRASTCNGVAVRGNRGLDRLNRHRGLMKVRQERIVAGLRDVVFAHLIRCRVCTKRMLDVGHRVRIHVCTEAAGDDGNLELGRSGSSHEDHRGREEQRAETLHAAEAAPAPVGANHGQQHAETADQHQEQWRQQADAGDEADRVAGVLRGVDAIGNGLDV
mmetsp:Transcript_39318/g.117596  ORF Transcript_39318/g.117596 Transcript_39318/m.117596 type:complete len:282 (+) Transcript_39318:236-1081(+)